MSDDKHHEIVIIKRGGGDHEDGHHGGAWKIAFADFMTAMMAFFLVMWLISASDKTKAVIAHYFNPVQLVDSTPQPKGLQDLKADAQSIMKFSGAPTSEKPVEKDPGAVDSKAEIEKQAAAQNKHTEPDKTAKHEAELFRDPYAVLAEIAAKNDAQPKVSKKAASEGVKGGSGAVGLKGGDAYRDPFEPIVQPVAPAASTPDEAALAKSVAEIVHPPSPPPVVAPMPKAVNAPPDAASAKVEPTDLAKPETGKSETAKPETAKPETAKSDTGTPQQMAQAAALRSKLEAAMQAENQGEAKATPAPKLDVHRTSEGLVIGLTDDANFAMFASASAEPSPKTVALMAKIGLLLKAEKGMVSIRGFTDNRPFKSDTYDNWRLSSARADMAHYMLVRGGLDDLRIEKIEGYADRRPKDPKDPGGAENRRIEILLRDAP